MRFLLLLFVLLAIACAQGGSRKLWMQREAGNDYAWEPQVWFIEDLETHTRCYAIRIAGHDGVAISCVPVKKEAQ